MNFVDRARATIQIAWLRLRLPSLLARKPLDGLLATFSVREHASPGDLIGLERAMDRSEAIVEHIPRLPRTCLYRCLARYAVFRRFGFSVEFVMAISPLGVDEDGHAWLELDGRPYREERAAEFVVSFRHPPSSRPTPGVIG